jgi:hypothetical protein
MSSPSWFQRSAVDTDLGERSQRMTRQELRYAAPTLLCGATRIPEYSWRNKPRP